MRTCIRCDLKKPFVDFHKDYMFKSGYKSTCKECYKNKVPVPVKVVVDHKICSTCKIDKKLELFNIDKKGKLGRHAYCKQCAKDKRDLLGNNKERQKKWRQNNLEFYKNYARMWSYQKLGIKITQEEYDLLVLKQQNRCAICQDTPSDGKVLCLDHNHNTLKVRGLLCNSCNIALGKFKDSKEILTKALDYLRDNEV